MSTASYKNAKRLPADLATTPLERHVLKFINDKAKGYDDSGISGAFEDLFHGGCASGYVSHLVYTEAAATFYRKHREEIGEIAARLIDDCEWRPDGIEGWDKLDPFANSAQNQNLLAWLGFEEAARAIAQRAGLDC